MSSKGRRHESTSDNISVSDIKGIVQKAVANATEVIRAEFAKVLDELSKRVRQLENSLNDISTEVFNHDISSLQRRVKVTTLPFLQTTYAETSMKSAYALMTMSSTLDD